jgi:hypothetical protein
MAIYEFSPINPWSHSSTPTLFRAELISTACNLIRARAYNDSRNSIYEGNLPATSAPIIRIGCESHSARRYEALPPWLFSMIVHMLAVIGLGMVQLGINTHDSLNLLFLASDQPQGEEIEVEGLADLDLDVSVTVASFSESDDTPAPLADNELLANLESDLENLVSSEGGVTSLLPGDGLGAIGDTSGSKGDASFFGLSGEGSKFVYVFDRSESMNSTLTRYSENMLIGSITPLLAAKAELVRSMKALSSRHQFQMVFYNHEPWLFSDDHYDRELFAATSENKQRAEKFVTSMVATGFTNHLGALDMAIDLEPDVIFLMTDAQAKDDLHPSVVRRMYKYCQRKGIVINIAHFSTMPRSNCTLIPLAEKTGGQHIFISLEDIADAMDDPAKL